MKKKLIAMIAAVSMLMSFDTTTMAYTQEKPNDYSSERQAYLKAYKERYHRFYTFMQSKKRVVTGYIYAYDNGYPLIMDDEGSHWAYDFNGNVPPESAIIFLWISDNCTPDNIGDDIIFHFEYYDD